jgi:hypothetical protein
MVKFNMLLVEILTVLFLIMSLLAPEACCRVLPEEKQNLLDIHILSSATTQKAFPSDRFNNVVSPFLRRQLLKSPVPPSKPNPVYPSTTSHSNTFIP